MNTLSSPLLATPVRALPLTRLQLEDEFGERIAARLEAGARSVPHDIGERLRLARMQAVSRRRVANVRARTAAALFAQGGTATLSAGDGPSEPRWWGALATALPIALVAAGVFFIQSVQRDHHVRDLAATDAAMLVDDLPPTAYADPGFAEFLHRTERGER